MTNWTLKSSVLKSGLVQIYKDISKSKWFNSCDDDFKYPFTKFNFQEAVLLENNFRITLPDEFKECCRIVDSDFKRKKRLRNRIINILEIPNENHYFVTFTFTNDVLDSTSSKTRRVYVSRFLKSISSNFVANIDFGAKNGREHYHAIISTENAFTSLEMGKKWGMGECDVKTIKNNSEIDCERMSKYISKLTNHAIKETCRRNHIIYSR